MNNVPVYVLIGAVSGHLLHTQQYVTAGVLLISILWLLISDFLKARALHREKQFVREITTSLKEKGWL